MADHYADLDREIWGDDPKPMGSPDPAADMMLTSRELVRLMGETVRMVQEAVASLDTRLEAIEAALTAKPEPEIERPQQP